MSKNLTVTNDYGETIDITFGKTWVGFKCDIEQTGLVVGSRRESNGLYLILENPNGFEGGYIGGQTKTTVMARDIW